MILAYAIAISLVLSACGIFAIRLAIAYEITKKANHEDWLARPIVQSYG